MHAFPQGSSLNVTAAPEASAAAAEPSRPQSASSSGAELGLSAEEATHARSEAIGGAEADTTLPASASQVTSDAAAVLMDRSEGGSSAASTLGETASIHSKLRPVCHRAAAFKGMPQACAVCRPAALKHTSLSRPMTTRMDWRVVALSTRE